MANWTNFMFDPDDKNQANERAENIQKIGRPGDDNKLSTTIVIRSEIKYMYLQAKGAFMCCLIFTLGNLFFKSIVQK